MYEYIYNYNIYIFNFLNILKLKYTYILHYFNLLSARIFSFFRGQKSLNVRRTVEIPKPRLLPRVDRPKQPPPKSKHTALHLLLHHRSSRRTSGCKHCRILSKRTKLSHHNRSGGRSGDCHWSSLSSFSSLPSLQTTMVSSVPFEEIVRRQQQSPVSASGDSGRTSETESM